MEDMNNTEKIIKALEGAKRALPSNDMIKRMEILAVKYSNKINSFSRKTIIGMAASFLILFAVNIYAVNEYNTKITQQSTEAEMDSYNLVPTKSIYK